jgi:hypothetical protein
MYSAVLNAPLGIVRELQPNRPFPRSLAYLRASVARVGKERATMRLFGTCATNHLTAHTLSSHFSASPSPPSCHMQLSTNPLRRCEEEECMGLRAQGDMFLDRAKARSSTTCTTTSIMIGRLQWLPQTTEPATRLCGREHAHHLWRMGHRGLDGKGFS